MSLQIKKTETKKPKAIKTPKEEIGILPIVKSTGSINVKEKGNTIGSLNQIDRVCYTGMYMTATAHALVGGTIAAALPGNPSLAITLCAISHPILDMIPHWDFGIGWKKKNKILLFLQAFGDLAFGVIVTFLIFGRMVDPFYLFLCILISESWDILQMPYLLWGWKYPFSFFYEFGHNTNSRASLPWGIITQVASVGGIALALRTLPVH